MSRALGQRAFEIFDDVCDLPEPDRSARLDARCADDTALRALVEQMLRHDDDDGAIELEPGTGARLIAAEFAAELAADAMDRLPHRIGSYHVIREIGRGGMGIVLEAEQDDPRRRVALKLIRDGLATPEMRRRFRREAQLLGHLQHRGIAHVYEAGAATIGHAGHPFIAMEFVEGRPIDEHADAIGLGLRERMELMARVCDAVQHAHAKGIIHRDLKPANVLVVQEASATGTTSESRAHADAIGQPKVLDFGVACLSASDAQGTLQTTAKQIVGTMGYMSPEQIEGRSDAIDTRTDVYALGVMLHRLVAGRMPFDLVGLSLIDVAQVIGAQEIRPLAEVDRAFRTDLETIVRKTLEKDPGRRYDSAGALAEDLRRCMRNEPIVARRATAMYQLRKFAQRNRALVGGVAATGLALVVGLVAVSILLAEVAAERDEATLARWRQGRIAEFQDYLLRSLDLQSMGATIMTTLRGDLDGWATSLGDRDTVSFGELGQFLDSVNVANLSRATFESELLDRAVAQVNEDYSDDPVVEATLRMTLAAMYRSVFRFDKALEQAERALSLLRRTLGPEHDTTLTCLVLCADAAEWEGMLELARERVREAIELQSRLHGVRDPRTADSRIRLAGLLTATEPDEAEQLLLDVLAHIDASEPGAARRLHAARSMLGGVYGTTGRLVEAISIYESMLAEFGDRTALRMNLAGLYRETGRFTEATEQFRQVMRIEQARHGDDDERTIVARSNLATMLGMAGDTAGEEVEGRTAYESSLRSLPPGREHRARVALSWGLCLVRVGRIEDARAVFAEAISTRRDIAGVRDALTAHLLDELGQCLRTLDRVAEAEAVFEESRRIRAG